jgi:hypothetical protein
MDRFRRWNGVQGATDNFLGAREAEMKLNAARGVTNLYGPTPRATADADASYAAGRADAVRDVYNSGRQFTLPLVNEATKDFGTDRAGLERKWNYMADLDSRGQLGPNSLGAGATPVRQEWSRLGRELYGVPEVTPTDLGPYMSLNEARDAARRGQITPRAGFTAGQERYAQTTPYAKMTPEWQQYFISKGFNPAPSATPEARKAAGLEAESARQGRRTAGSLAALGFSPEDMMAKGVSEADAARALELQSRKDRVQNYAEARADQRKLRMAGKIHGMGKMDPREAVLRFMARAGYDASDPVGMSMLMGPQATATFMAAKYQADKENARLTAEQDNQKRLMDLQVIQIYNDPNTSPEVRRGLKSRYPHLFAVDPAAATGTGVPPIVIPADETGTPTERGVAEGIRTAIDSGSADAYVTGILNTVTPPEGAGKIDPAEYRRDPRVVRDAIDRAIADFSAAMPNMTIEDQQKLSAFISELKTKRKKVAEEASKSARDMVYGSSPTPGSEF